MSRVLRLFLEFWVLAVCIVLSLVVQQPLILQIVRVAGYGCLGLIFSEWVLIVIPRTPAIFRWIFAVRFRPARVSMGMVLFGISAYFLTVYGYHPHWGGWVTIAAIAAFSWPLLEVVIWACGIGLTPSEPAQPEVLQPALPPYVPEEPGNLETDDGLTIFRDFINTLDKPSGGNKEV